MRKFNLANLRARRAAGDSGFTLIELLVVMIIIGILAAIAIPVFINQRAKAYDTQVKSDLKSIATAEEGIYTTGATYVAIPDASTNDQIATLFASEGLKLSDQTVFMKSTADSRDWCVQLRHLSDKAGDTVWSYSGSKGLQEGAKC